MKYIVDTHALLWFLANNPKLGPQAKAVLQDPHNKFVLPAIVLAEACWIIEHGRVSIPISAVISALDADLRFEVHPLDRAVIDKSIGLSSIKEMHDRQIVATALIIAGGETIAVLTCDLNITASALVPIIW